MVQKRRWGYLVWVVAGIAIAVPELIAAIDGGALPFTTISEMVGHLERRWPVVELAVVAAIVFLLFSTVRFPPQTPRTEGTPEGGSGEELKPTRTSGGRLTVQAPPTQPSAASFDEQAAPAWFGVAAVLSFALVIGATLAAIAWWDDPHHFHPAYVLYGLLALLWLVVPSIYAFVKGTDPPFPTLFRTITNLEEWLSSRPWLGRFGPVLAWLVAYLILTGLVILLLHLAFYPYPDITHILNPNG
ncbi:MAG: hypothetical protein M3R70_01750 [Actinomycetota bacterium]|nr:hypothetical protein [Actinomycetota bacterium]